MRLAVASSVALAVAIASAARADLTDSLKPGAADIRHAGPMAFGPDGVLFIGDKQQGAVFAVTNGDTQGDAAARAGCPALVRVDGAGKLSEVKLADAKFARATLGNIAATGNQRSPVDQGPGLRRRLPFEVRGSK